MDGYDAESNKRLEMLELVQYICPVSEGTAKMDVKSLMSLSAQFTFEVLGGKVGSQTYIAAWLSRELRCGVGTNCGAEFGWWGNEGAWQLRHCHRVYGSLEMVNCFEDWVAFQKRLDCTEVGRRKFSLRIFVQ